MISALGPSPGERVLDIGTGPGFVAHEMAPLVLPGGKILGIDISEPMLELGRVRCADDANVTFDTADATELPVPDGGIDVAVSVQVYEYIPRVEEALAELYRVLRPGGRAAIVSSDWTSIVWSGASDDLTRRILAAFSAHCAHQQLPRTLGPKLRSTGFEIGDQVVLPQFNPTYDADSMSARLIDGIVAFVSGRGVTDEEAAAWAKDLERSGTNGEYFFCLNQYLFCVTKPTRRE